MSKTVSHGRSIRELAATEMDLVGGGLLVKGGGVVISQPLKIGAVPTGYIAKATFNLIARLTKLL